jgi:hypothetical protein
MPADIITKPEKHFSLPACRHCRGKPCLHLRLGGVYAGKYLLVHSSAGVPDICPFAASQPGEMRLILRQHDQTSLLILAERAFCALTGVERYSSHYHRAVNRDENCQKLNFLLSLLQRRLLRMVRVPYGYESDNRIRSWLKAHQGNIQATSGERHEFDEMADALTDNLTQDGVLDQEVSITDPRWEHVDEQKEENRPEKAMPGDVIRLLATLKGMAEGAAVTFDIFDCAQDPPMRYETVKGKNIENTATGEWTVQLAEEEGGANVAFEVIARSKTSERCPVAIEIDEFVLSI